MGYSDTINSRWREQYDRHAVGVLAHDAIDRTLSALNTIEAQRVTLADDVHLSARGKQAEMMKVAAGQGKVVEQARRTLNMGRDALRTQRLALVPKPADRNNVADMMMRQEIRENLRRKSFADLTAMLADESTPIEIYQSIFEAPPQIMGINQAQHDSLIEITVNRLGGPALAAIGEQAEALDLLEATCRHTADALCRGAGIPGHNYNEWIAKVAPIDDLTIASEKAAFEVQINAPAVELTPLVVRSQVVRQLLETGVA